MIADASDRAVTFALAPGQAHELPHAMPLLARLPDVPIWVVADRGYTPSPSVPEPTNDAPTAKKASCRDP